MGSEYGANKTEGMITMSGGGGGGGGGGQNGTTRWSYLRRNHVALT